MVFSRCQNRRGYRIDQFIKGLPVKPWDKMAVNVNCHLDRQVTQLVPDVSKRFALLKQKAGKRVPDVVKSNLRMPTGAKALGKRLLFHPLHSCTEGKEEQGVDVGHNFAGGNQQR
jgi:hypothetical protein